MRQRSTWSTTADADPARGDLGEYMNHRAVLGFLEPIVFATPSTGDESGVRHSSMPRPSPPGEKAADEPERFLGPPSVLARAA